MIKKKFSSVISIIFLLVIVILGVYYLWPKSPPEITNQSSQYPADFKILKKDLFPQEIDSYLERFILTKQSLAENPDQLDGWLELGIIKKYIGDYQGAEAAWLKAGEIRPKNSTSFGNLADLYTNFTKEYNKAEPMYRQAIANSLGEAKNVAYYRNFYYFYKYYLKDDEKSEQILLEAIRDNPQSSEPLILLASFYKEKGQNLKAIQYYQKSLVIDPNDKAVKEELEKLR